MRILGCLSLLFLLSGCGFFFDRLAESNMSNSEIYDRDVCEHGDPSPPNVRRREGCVNNKTTQQNYAEFQHYETEREIHLNK